MRWLYFIIVVGLFLCGYSVLVPFAFGAQPSVVVSSQTGFPQSTSYSITIPPVLYDLDGDGDMEVVVVSEHTVYAYDNSGVLLWSSAAGIISTALQNAPIVGDINGDNKGEVITFGFLESGYNLQYYNYLYTFNSTNEKFHLTTGSNYNYNGWQYEMNAKPGSPAFIDLDNDRIDEIVVATAGNAEGGEFKAPPALFAFDNSSRLWYQTLPSPTIRTTASAVGDVNKDSNPDVIVILDGLDDIIAYSVNGSGATELWRTGITTSSRTTRTAAIGDVYGDSNNEVIVAADNGVFTLKGTDGSEIWHRITDPINYSSPVIGDIDNDGSNEIVVGSITGKVYALNGNNGADMSNFPVSTGRDIWSTPALVDLDGDSKKEIIVGSWDGNVHAWYSDGTIVDGFPIEVGPVITSSPAVADIDNDGNLELAIGADNYKIYVWDLYVIYPPIVIIDSPTSGIFLNGTSISFDGSGSYDDISISSYEWSSSINGILSTSQSFSTSTLSLGDHTITLEVTDNENAVNSSSISIYINNPPTVVIDSPDDGNVTVWNDDVTFNCTAMDTGGTIASYEWVSDINGTIGTLATFTTSSLMAGIHDIVLTVTDNKGTSVTDSITINVNIPPVVSINFPSQSSIFDHGESITFNGTATDEDGTITAYSWVSDKDGVIGNSSMVTTSVLTSGI
ncbi:MAG: FG-GAP-like repeat-containing protein, partial [Methanosarcinaceae archaeon]|nr:FG-GAP-like repeat-containing protein [Methanosarcinaceae archaeon]